MEKGFIALVSLVSLSFEIFFVKIDCEQLSDLWFQNPWSKKCVGNEGQLEGTLRHQGNGCNLSFTFNMIQ
jgi:hypothetical protein